ncbi:MAG: YceI family protein [Planctomycetaceae bacterium]|nr:YceI family protein [Planctomycetaceae bacterium]
MSLYQKCWTAGLANSISRTRVSPLGFVCILMVCVAFSRPDQKAVATTTPVRTDTNAENEQPEKNQISVKKSRVFTFVEKTGLGHQHGVEGRLKSGSIQLGAGQDAGTLVFDMASFDADTDAARNYLGLEGSTSATTREQVNSNMRSTPILNVREFPTATFVIQSAKRISDQDATGKSRYELSGDFTLRGKTRPLKFMAEVQQKDGMNHVTGKFSILQTQYGITPFKKALGAVGVADRLTIHGDLWLAM